MTNRYEARLTLQHTLGHIDCKACIEANHVLHQPVTPDMLFLDAFDLWLSHRRIDAAGVITNARYLAPKTERDYRACALALAKFFGRLRLGQITPGHLVEYQRARAVCDRSCGQWSRPCGANRIRKEAAVMIRLLKAARLWGDDEESVFLRLRPVESETRRALEPDEQARFLKVAQSRVEWQVIHWYAIVALQTTASTIELRRLRLADIKIEQGVVLIRPEGAKNKYRVRTIPLESPAVVWALERLVARAGGLGAALPHHYLFPFREGGERFDPLRPMSDSGIKGRFNEVRAAAGLGWLRPYDLRHTAITRMAEVGTPVQVIMAFAGHMTLRMQQHYTAVSEVVRRRWARASWSEDALPPRKMPSRENQSGTRFPHESARTA